MNYEHQLLSKSSETGRLLHISLEFRALIEFACGYTDTIKEDHRLVSLLENNHSTKSRTNTEQCGNSP